MADSKRTFLNFSDKSVDAYKALARELGGLANKDVFLLAMAWGYQNGCDVHDDFKKSGTGVRLEYLKDEDQALMAALQLAVTKDPESILDMEQRYDIAERYAEGGVRLLARMMDDEGDFSRRMSAEVKQQASALAKAQATT